MRTKIDESPANEYERIKDLYAHGILDTGPEKDYDQLVEMASQICDCPIAAITFIDKERQWFKAKVGDTVKETSRSISFCSQTIESAEPLIVHDATKDERFINNPDVTGGLNIRFYAGFPITSSKNLRLGAVCVIDTVPRSLTTTQVNILSLVAKQVSHLLELRLRDNVMRGYSKKAMQQTEETFIAFFENSNLPKWIFEIDTLKFLTVNSAAVKKYGFRKKEFEKMTVLDIRNDEGKNNFADVLKVNKSKTPLIVETDHKKKNGVEFKVEVMLTDIVYLGRSARLATVTDLSLQYEMKEKLDNYIGQTEKEISNAELRGADEAKDLIGQELHDNVNQLLACTKLFLGLAKNHEHMRVDMINRCAENIEEAMAGVRDLSHSLTSIIDNDFKLIPAFHDLVSSLSLGNTVHFHSCVDKKVEELASDMKINLFRIVQEQTNNILKHAQASEVFFSIKCTDVLQLSIEDNGVGFDLTDKKSGIGLTNIKKRAIFYNGTCDIISKPNEGCKMVINLPLE